MTRTHWWSCAASLVAVAFASLAAPAQNTPVGRPPAPAAEHGIAATQAPPNIILITLDTTRADRMGFLGSKRGLTPNLDALARQSVVFERAYAQAPLTSVSHATILTGTYPQYHLVVDYPLVLAKDLPYAPEILRAHGYQTAAFLGSLALDPNGGAPGFDRAFDTYDANFHLEDLHTKDRYHSVQRRGDEVVAHALAWLDGHSKTPFFLWVHLFDAHDPYDPPEPYKTRYAKELYDGGIAYEDAAVGKLLRQLKARGLYDGAVMAVMADHGESLGAHGEDMHGIFVYDETIQVPLVIKLPKQASAGTRIANRVELVDVLPTLLQTAGIAAPAEVQGQSMLGLMTAQEGTKEAGDVAQIWRDRPAYAQADYAHLAYGWSALQSWRTGKYLYVQAPRRELYDEAGDPKAEHNLASSSAAVADTLGSQLEAFRQKTTGTRQAPTADLDPARQRQLAALGYVVTGANASKSGPAEQGADPKDKIETVNTMRKLNYALQDGHLPEALGLLEQLSVTDPMPTVFAKLGEIYMQTREFQKAVPAFRKAVELEPDFTNAQMNLGKALLQTQDFEGAATAFEGLIAKQPKLLDAHVLLEITYARANRGADEIKECEKVLAFLPDHYGSNLMLGRFLAQSGDLEGAVPRLQKAAAVRPEAPVPHMFLADVYAKLGRQADADQERGEAQRLGGNPSGAVSAPVQEQPGSAQPPANGPPLRPPNFGLPD
ncbi:MAG: sulfatase-like hydrolase/transferase [Terriglobales bacterium]